DINLQPCINMIEYAGYGVEGMVTDAQTGDPVAAVVYVGTTLPCYTDPVVGDFHKFIMPGTYNIKVKANGYQTKIISNVNVEEFQSTVVDVQLEPEEHQSVYQVCASQRPDAYPEHQQPSWEVIGPPDNISYSLGLDGWIVVDMQELVVDGQGSDLIVFEGDATPEGYEVYAGPTIDGPWTSIGQGSGTAEFDLEGSAISEARYFKIEDDGDGNNTLDAGFELDAVQSISSIAGAYILMDDMVVDDSQGNNNGKVDPGETANLIITLKNIGTEDALNIFAELLTEDNYVEVLTAEPQEFGDILMGESATATYTVTAAEVTPAGHVASLELNYYGDNGVSGSKFIELLFPDYCYPTANCSFGDGFSGFALEEIDNLNNGCSTGGYGDFTDMTATLTPGETYTVQWWTAYSDQYATLWIDLDVDKEFDAEEMLIEDFNLVNSNQAYYADFTLPESVAPGEYRLRIRARWLDSSTDPCSSFSYGETEDYTVVVEGGNAIVPDFIADVNEVCEGGTVQFTDQSQGDVTGWEWEFPGGNPSTSTEANPVVSYPVGGDFDVTLTVYNQVVTESVTYPDFITVHALPIVQFSEINDMCINWPAYELVEGSPEGGAYSGPGVTDGWFYPEEAGLGTHTLTYTYTDENGCENFAGQTVYVDACTGIAEQNGTFAVRPNPSDGNFKLIAGRELTNASIRIVNAFGKTVFSQSSISASGGESLEISLNVVPGLYVLIIEEETITTARIIVE
ncbi:MAG: GEVED domain-containing protein, partial [Bacteroidota bacterium]